MEYIDQFNKWKDTLEELGFKTKAGLSLYSRSPDCGIYTLEMDDSGEYTNVHAQVTSPTVREILIDSYSARWTLNVYATRPSHDAIDKGALLDCIPVHEKFKTFDELIEYLTNGIGA